MVGVVILDTALVTVSRTRRGVTLVTGGRDHLSHRLLPVLHSPRGGGSGARGDPGDRCARSRSSEIGRSGEVLAISGLITVSLGVVAIAVLDSERWRPPGIAVGASCVTPRPMPRRRREAPTAVD